MTNLEQWLKEVESRCEKAVEGQPWYVHGQAVNQDYILEGHECSRTICLSGDEKWREFIAASRTDLPKAVAVIRELMGAMDCHCEYTSPTPEWMGSPAKKAELIQKCDQCQALERAGQIVSEK